MAIQELKQTLYRSSDDSSVHRTSDHRQDMTHYHVPLMRMHQAALHGWGIATGLQVTQSGPTALTIAEGVVIDGAGRPLAGFKEALLSAGNYLGRLLAVTWGNWSPNFLTYHTILRGLLGADRELTEGEPCGTAAVTSSELSPSVDRRDGACSYDRLTSGGNAFACGRPNARCMLQLSR